MRVGQRTDTIEVILPGGRRVGAVSGRPLAAVLAEVIPGGAENVVAARVDGVLQDLTARPPQGARVELITLDHPDGLQVVRHSAAHLMAAAVQELFPGTRFAIGPPIEDGFYYDMELPRALTPDDLPLIEEKMAELARQDLPYQRIEMSLEEALTWAREHDQVYKVEILDAIRQYGSSRPDAAKLKSEADVAAGTVSFYQTGTFLDLCRGPHVVSAGQIRTFKLTHLAGAYWRGDERNPMLQRIYGTAFASREDLNAHLARLEEAKRRDHRRLGRDLDLFSVADEVGGGLILWHPRGSIIRKVIEDFWREKHLADGYDLVFTPHVGRAELWETSGHLDFYQEHMYPRMEMEGNDYYLKPMNCPFHIMIYQSKVRSYRDLPLRYAELGTVYRFERAGVLHGLLRVRGFTQDDAHLFCTPSQVDEEITRAVRFSLFFLRTFGFDHYEVYIATKPDKYVGDPAQWETATEALKRAAERAGQKYEIDQGGGAFYGPKIDIRVRDALGRPWQCTTVQFDFNLPERFNIGFIGEDNHAHRPYMIHRALLGSLERFLGVLIEHYGGAFPVWLAPVQALVIPVADRHHAYARTVAARLRSAGVRVEVDLRNEKVGYKIRQAEVRKVPFALVVGDREAAAHQVSVRSRGGQDRGIVSLETFVGEVERDLGPPAEPESQRSPERR